MTSRRAPSASTSRVALVATAGPVRRAAASNRPPFRKSLIQVGEDYQNFDWQERDNLTRRPAQSALAGLLQVGEEDDIIGLDAGRINRYEAFKSLKLAYLSESTFLSTSFLLPFHPKALQDPLSPLSTLIKLSNLTTFLYLLLSSAPDAQGNRSRISSNNLEQAALAFLVHIVPVDSPIHDGVLKMLLSLKCQSYLSARANSRVKNSPPAAQFFSAELAAYLPPSSSASSLSNRESTIRFKSFSLDLIRQAEAVNGDVKVLETIWRWEDCQNELREYCKDVANSSFGGEEESGSDSGSGEGEGLVGETEAQKRRREEEEEDSSDEETIAAKGPRRSDSIVAELLGAISPSKIRKLSSPLARRGASMQPTEDSESSSSEADSSQEETQAESLDTDHKKRLRELNQLWAGDESGGEDETIDTQAKARLAELAPLLDTSETLQDDEDDSATELDSRTVELYQEMQAIIEREATMEVDSDSPEEVEEDDEAEKAFAKLDAEDQADAAEVSRQLSAGIVTKQAGEVQVLRIQADHSLAFGPPKPVKRSLLDRQDDAVKISFDTQETHSSLSVEHSSLDSNPSTQRLTRAMKGKGRAVTSPPPPAAIPAKKSKKGKGKEKVDEMVEGGRARETEAEEKEALGGAMVEEVRGGADPDWHIEDEYGGGGDDDYQRPAAVSPGAVRIESPVLARKRRRTASEARDQNSQPTQIALKGRTVVDDSDSEDEMEIVSAPVAGPSSRPLGEVDLSDEEMEIDEKTLARRRAHQALAMKEKARATEEREKELEQAKKPPRWEFILEGDTIEQRPEKRRKRIVDANVSDDEESEPEITNYARIKRPANGKVPWTKVETDLLLREMALFGSSRWSDLCTRHGCLTKPRGLLSDTFRDRNNVALRDKAITLKKGMMSRLEEGPEWMAGIAVPKKTTKKQEEAKAKEDAWKKKFDDNDEESEEDGIMPDEEEEEEEEEEVEVVVVD